MPTDTVSPGRLFIETDAGLLRIRIVNPARYNAMSLGMWEALGAAVADAQTRPDVRAIVLEGDGERAFVSGADISEFGAQRRDPAQVARYDRAVAGAQQALTASAVPTIALIRGICMGGGMGLALACDLRYCNQGARFRMPAARLGLGYALSGVKRMRDVLGSARAADLFLTARTFDGLEAARIGLVQEVFADADFNALAAERLATVAANAPLTLRAARLALHHLQGGSQAPASEAVDQAVQACFCSEDYQEGQAAFRDKRAPVFKGR
ncbi:enoyl-CoA hydratase [Bordetella sp. BOR01]|uniref:enoyl-CoA hydratase n=1 Tax=Bordetella sp. BOR01 TaxID=2854779 RepID=UPI001C43F326|nr:enoyl-CoA hydratase [Bordetella sp. BOR01]MBV7485933.1 enoyl-CoA hydratase/isomerase family protein [Bordetella sp. BOR01]